jgi:prepilin-type N-terminal cleavage/methylation domain-containing protein
MRGFTLVELLTVVAIIALITGLTIPALKGLGGAAGLSGAGTQFEDLAVSARQNSISKGVLTAVAVLTGPTSAAQPNPAYRTFMVLQFAPGTSSTNWQEVSKWETLNTGCIVDNGKDSSGNPYSSFLESPSIPITSSIPPPMPTLTYLNVQYPPVTNPDQYPPASGNYYAYQIFTPEGRFYSDNIVPLVPCSLRIAQGFYNGSAPTYTSGTTNYYKFIFNDATGQIKVIRP